jgi:hypothetical protein
VLDSAAVLQETKIVRVTVFAVLALAAAMAAGNEVYRSYDAEGNVIYSDRPQGENAEPIRVIAPGLAAALAPARTALAAAPQTAQPDAEPLGVELARDPNDAEMREIRARNCEIARERHLNYTQSRRLFRSLPSGEREYLSDAELNEARARAAADVENWCD